MVVYGDVFKLVFMVVHKDIFEQDRSYFVVLEIEVSVFWVHSGL